MMLPFWQTYQIAPGQTRHWQIGPLDLWVRHLPGEWQIIHESALDDRHDTRWTLAAESAWPSDKVVNRFSVDTLHADDRITLSPELPDRPIVSKPTSRIEIPAGTHARFYCGIPLNVRLKIGPPESPLDLTSVPTRSLSRTWFGTPQQGEPCYATLTRAVRTQEELQPYLFRVICPVKIRNRSNAVLPFERICLRVQHLGIYQGKTYLWTNTSSVVKSTSQPLSQVTFSKGAPGEERDAVLITPPRERASGGNLLLRTFGNLRHLADLR
ncbi:MAG: hypothetical protein KGS60_15545 [Verrucomicrobia bacterium]|nr:hypothetical protein [Verrucomicrobiota bacterium]